MPRIIKDGAIVECDWQRVDMEQTLPAGNVLVPYKRWQQERDALEQHEGKISIYLEGDDETRSLKDSLSAFELIAVDFPKFTDGRGYSHARILRDELGYTGELRAIGDVLRDQVFYLARCGFNALAVREDRDIEDALEGLRDFSTTYQAAADNQQPIYRRENESS